MGLALLALDPTVEKCKTYNQFCEIVQQFQSKGLFSQLSVVSIMHASLYTMPYRFYKDLKGKLTNEALERIRKSCNEHLDFSSARILQSNSSDNESHIAQLSRYGKRIGANMLILASNNRKGLPYWFLGSFSETAALTASLSVLIIKPNLEPADFSKHIRFVVGIDVAAPPSLYAINRMAQMAKSMGAEIHLIYVKPQKRLFVDSLQDRKSDEEAKRILLRIKNTFDAKDIDCKISILKESNSVGHTIADFSEKHKAWLTIVTSPKRQRVRRVLLGSHARKILTLTHRPFLDLRLE